MKQRKQCQMCNKTKSTTEFFKRGRSKDGFGSYCKPCKLEKNSTSWRKNRNKHLDQRKDAHLKKLYGIGIKEFKKMLSEQKGMCAICLTKDNYGKKLAVDHCHTTGKIRGLLCNRCNRAIGLLDDDKDRVLRMHKYLIWI
jgi:hypothetical protein